MLESQAWRIFSASVAGTRHNMQGLECQDAHAVGTLGDGTLIAAVADGAGSAVCAAAGAACAVLTSIEYLKSRMASGPPSEPEGYRLLLLDTVEDARMALNRQCQREGAGRRLDDFATTLLIVIVTELWTSAIQIGDGAIVSRDPSGCFRVFSQPASSEYFNETTFLSSSDYKQLSVFNLVPSKEIDAIAMLTDGMQLLAFTSSDNSAYAPFFSPLLEFTCHRDSTNAELEAFLRSDRVCERTDDDKTLILAVRV